MYLTFKNKFFNGYKTNIIVLTYFVRWQRAEPEEKLVDSVWFVAQCFKLVPIELTYSYIKTRMNGFCYRSSVYAYTKLSQQLSLHLQMSSSRIIKFVFSKNHLTWWTNSFSYNLLSFFVRYLSIIMTINMNILPYLSIFTYKLLYAISIAKFINFFLFLFFLRTVEIKGITFFINIVSLLCLLYIFPIYSEANRVNMHIIYNFSGFGNKERRLSLWKKKKIPLAPINHHPYTIKF